VLTVEADEERGGMIRRRGGGLSVTGSDQLYHVTDGLVDVALALLSALGAQRHVALAVQHVPRAAHLA